MYARAGAVDVGHVEVDGRTVGDEADRREADAVPVGVERGVLDLDDALPRFVVGLGVRGKKPSASAAPGAFA